MKNAPELTIFLCEFFAQILKITDFQFFTVEQFL